jgi:chromosome segregation ATPase
VGYGEDFVNWALSSTMFSTRRTTMTLDEKVEAILNLCTTMAVQIQKNTDEIKELRSDVSRLENRMEALEKGQKRIDERLAIMTDQIAGNHSRTKSIEERLMINDQRLQRLEDRIFPAMAEAV